MKTQSDKKNFEQMDIVLAQILRLSASQLDFIINYGIKYRIRHGANYDD